MKRYLPVFLLLATLAVPVDEANAQFQLGIRGGYDLDVDEALIGAEARFGLNNPSFPLIIAPAFDYFFTDDVGGRERSFYALDLNLLYPFGINNQTFTPYAGAGLGIGLGDLVDTDLGVNLLGGATFGFGNIRPYVQARLKFGADRDLASLQGGVLFSL